MTNPYTTQTAASRAGRTVSNDALSALEDALAAPSTTRVGEWHSRVIDALDALTAALGEQAGSDQDTDSLLSEITRDAPRFASRIERLHAEHDDLRKSAESLRAQIAIEADHSDIDVGDIRDRLAAIAHRVRRHRAREADLVYEAVNVDLGLGD